MIGNARFSRFVALSWQTPQKLPHHENCFENRQSNVFTVALQVHVHNSMFQYTSYCYWSLKRKIVSLHAARLKSDKNKQ